MCGIAGIVGMFDTETARVAVEQMIGTMARRGPDAEGIAELGGVILGHRRLAIFDLSDSGAQPMATADSKIWVVFNGAIYNFKSLRAELEKTGCRFRGTSDTEVLLHGYRVWGIEPLARRLRGMFAFGLWDERSRELYLVRDRLGVKPLVFATSNGHLAFASTVGALKHGGFAEEIDDRALLDLLRWGFVGEQHCIYRGVHKLPPGTILEWRNGKCRQYRYWETPRQQNAARLSFDEAVAEVENRLREAVAVRLEADVPVAALLSGGIDSSLICWAVADLGADLTAYTVGVPGDPSDESAAAASTAQRLGIRHCTIELGDAAVPDLDELLTAYDEPFPCSSALGMLRISRAISTSAKVVLTGDGGDDLFLGYPRHRHLWLAGMLAKHMAPGLAETWRRWGLDTWGIGPLRRAGALLNYASGGVEAFLSRSTGLVGYRSKGLLGPRFEEPMREVSVEARSESAGMVETLVEFERNSRFVSEYLKKVDGATMHYGIEARSPFLDQELWNVGSELPVGLRLRRGELKAILRALARRHVGIGAATRKKHGFKIPAQRWLISHWRERAEQAFSDSKLAQEGWIDAHNIFAQLRRAADLGTAGDELWNLFVIESWLQHEGYQASRRAGVARRVPGTATAQERLC